jgi:hypothetical protein
VTTHARQYRESPFHRDASHRRNPQRISILRNGSGYARRFGQPRRPGRIMQVSSLLAASWSGAERPRPEGSTSVVCPPALAIGQIKALCPLNLPERGCYQPAGENQPECGEAQSPGNLAALFQFTPKGDDRCHSGLGLSSENLHSRSKRHDRSRSGMRARPPSDTSGRRCEQKEGCP